MSQEIIIPILNSITYRIFPNTEYRAYKLASKFFYDPESNHIIYMSHLRAERQYSKWSTYDLDYYNPVMCEPKELWIAGDEMVTPLSSYNLLKQRLRSNEMNLYFNVNYGNRLKQINELMSKQKYIYEQIHSDYEKEQLLIRKQQSIKKFKQEMGANLNRRIIIHDGYYRLPTKIRFKLLKNVDENTIINNDFIVNEFRKTINHLFRITNQDYIVLMLPRMKSNNQRRWLRNYEVNTIHNTLSEYGFNNISITGANFTIDQ